MLQICFTSCMTTFFSVLTPTDICLVSADLEITVPMLVQVDKLVQLIESPVFTCEYKSLYRGQ